LSNQLVSSRLEWAPARHNSGTKDTKRAQTHRVSRAKFRERIFNSNARLADQLRLNHQIEAHKFGENYADRHLSALDACLHFDTINFSDATSDTLQEYAEKSATTCATLSRTSEPALSKHLARLHLTLPKNAENLNSVTWWRQLLYKTRYESLAHVYRAMGLVGHKFNQYIDDQSVRTYQRNKLRTRIYLEENYLTSSSGQRLSLADLSDLSISNPKHRRTEMMTHLRGLSEWAKARGDVATFVTLTTPSKMHRMKADGDRNQNYDGTHVRMAQAYLQSVWSLVRSKLARDSISIYGMRVAEPHQDGCPHWHLLVFTKPSDRDHMINVFEKYALFEDRDEPGASQHRIKFEICDPEKGSPASYMAKYVSKNIDGYGLETDDFGNSISSSSERILAWSRHYRIRQFQFFGVPPRSIWRELRRVKTPINHARIEQLRQAADLGDYRLFLDRYYELHTRDHIQPLKVIKVDAGVDACTGEIVGATNEGQSLRYLQFDGECFPTQVHTWTKTSPPDFLKKLERDNSPRAAGGIGERFLQNQVASLGLVSITVRNNILQQEQTGPPEP
jgi:hypothetical protein